MLPTINKLSDSDSPYASSGDDLDVEDDDLATLNHQMTRNSVVDASSGRVNQIASGKDLPSSHTH